MSRSIYRVLIICLMSTPCFGETEVRILVDDAHFPLACAGQMSEEAVHIGYSNPQISLKKVILYEKLTSPSGG